MTNIDKNKRHQQRMQRQKEVVDESVQQADKDKGLLLVITGNGKGKSSSGFGMVARALGHDMRVGIVQFIFIYISHGILLKRWRINDYIPVILQNAEGFTVRPELVEG